MDIEPGNSQPKKYGLTVQEVHGSEMVREMLSISVIAQISCTQHVSYLFV